MNTKQDEKSLKNQPKKLKKKQIEIIDLIVRFRHLQQPQIQQLLKHKHKERIRTWLNDLVERKYLFRIYEKEIGGKPSEYCLDKGCISYLRDKKISERLIKRVYKEKTNSQALRNKSQFLATIYLSLITLILKTKATLNFYTKDDLHNIRYMILPLPDSYFAITEKTGSIERYFLEVFDNEKFMYKRVYQYLNYHKKQFWQKNTIKPFPKIILICSNEKAKENLYKFIQKKLTQNSPLFYLSIWEEIRKDGINKNTLKKVG